MIIIKDFKTKLKNFIETRRGPWVIWAAILFVVSIVMASIYIYCEGVAKITTGVIFIVIFVISALMFSGVLWTYSNKANNGNKVKEEKISKEKKKELKQEYDKIKRLTPRMGLSTFGKVILAIYIVSGFLWIGGICMAFSEVPAVKIAGIVLACFFGLIFILGTVFIRIFMARYNSQR